VRPVWALYTSTLIAIWQRLVSLNISWDFDVLGEVVRKRGIFTVVVPPAGDRRVIDIYLMLITSKARFIKPSEISSAVAEIGRCRITAVISCWDSGIEGEVWEVIAVEVRADG
jgi:hypothetical protein